MARRKSARMRKPRRAAKRGGSRVWVLVLLLAAAAVAAVVYFALAPLKLFVPRQASTPARMESAESQPEAVREQAPAAVKPAEPVATPPAEPAATPPAEAAPVPAESAAPVCTASVLSLSDVQGMYTQPGMKVVDVRPAERFSAGHVPGAINIPAADFDAVFREEFIPQGVFIILYGEDTADESPIRVCVLLMARGHRSIQLFKEGWSRWAGSGMPKE